MQQKSSKYSKYLHYDHRQDLTSLE